MFQSRYALLTCALALIVALPVASAQETKSGEQAPGGFKLTPNVVVQEEMDEKKLTNKVSMVMGFKLMSNFKSSGQDVNMGRLFEGMKAAVNGPDQKSFITGYQLMKNMQENGADLDLNNLFEGMKLAQDGKELGLTDEQVQGMMTSFGKVVEARAMAKIKKQSADNLAAGDAFVKKMSDENPGVKKLDNGVAYQVLVAGTGASPTREDKVKIDYHGTFIDGTVFDSTVKPLGGRPPAPVTYPAGGFVPGFSSALQAMKVGSKWKIVIPGPLAYGAAGGGGGKIGPNQTLIFEVSLLGIEKAEEAPNPKKP